MNIEDCFQAACLDDAYGAAEKRTEPYKGTVKGVSEAATQRIAKSFGRVGGFADEQAKAARSLK